eukprot:1782924-Ditylum_brightwellii.AAC.1
MAAKRAAVLANKKKEVFDQQDGPKTCIECEVESNVLMVYCECIKERCKECGTFCTLCEEVLECYGCFVSVDGWYCAKCNEISMVYDEVREMQGKD